MEISGKPQAKVRVIEMTPKDAGKVSLCGHKNPSSETYQHKFQWITKRMPEGLKVKMLSTPDEGLAGYIEYVPGERAWRAVNAENYMFIHCIYMEKRYKDRGYGTLLVKECMKDARKAGMNGAAVVTREGTWMAGQELFLKNGFEEVEKALPDFSLLVKKFKKSAPTPSFKGQWEKKRKKFGKGLTIITSGQCPHNVTMVNDIAAIAKDKYGIEPRIVEYRSYRQAQNAPWPYAVAGLLYNGKLVADHTISGGRFRLIMEKELGIAAKKRS
ncbi:MAG: GNAT family N-acetyltransferase [Sedimentisphaerales bacterium]|nr:GNAT family N-acetyltransferase [Sedimentisphaerales bacterium]